MKILKISFLFAFAFLLNSCSIDDEPTSVPSLYGTWNLVQVSNIEAETSQTFPRGTIVWGFDLETIMVNNNNTDSNLQDGFSRGTYNYTFDANPTENTPCIKTISFSEANVNCIDFDRNTLVITQTEAGGLSYYFVR